MVFMEVEEISTFTEFHDKIYIAFIFETLAHLYDVLMF